MIPPNYHAPTSCEGSDRVRRPDEQTKAMFSHLSPEERVRPDHPLRAIRRMTDQVLQELSPRFTRMYSDIGPPSIPPEQLLRALLLQGLYTIRSERLVIEEIDYSPMHSFIGRAKANKPSWRILATCSSTTVMGWSPTCVPRPQRARLEREAALELLKPACRAQTVAGDKTYDAVSFVAGLRELEITPHVAQKPNSAIDGRTTRHAGYAVSQRKRKLPPRRLENETDHLRELRFDRNALVNTLDGLGIGARVTFSSSC
jgi:Transposase domain (DUF772)